jgi:hypothetical protein
MAQTAVGWLVNQINGHSYSIGLPYGMNIRIDIPDDIIEQAKVMEKEQIIEAVKYGDVRGKLETYLTAEQYYNETYEGKNNS